jgi:hypothetical protein
MWCRMVEISLSKKSEDGDGFYAAKVMTARFYFARLLPESNSLFTTLMAGSDSLMAMPAEAF